MTPSTRAVVVGLTALVLTACTTDGAEQAPASPSAADPGPLVLFQGQGRAHLEVGTARADGSGITYPLSDLPGGDQTNPDWSPDGSRVVFVLNDGARDDLWIADADGGDPQLLLDCAGSCRFLDDPAWSPNGAQVVYSRTTTRGPDALGSLETVDVATGDVEVWLPMRVRHFTAGARWSPLGSYVVYEDVHTTGRRLDAEVDRISLRTVRFGDRVPGPPLTDRRLFAATADWSPDGQRIVYAGLAQPGAEVSDLFVVPLSGGDPVQVTHLAAAGGYANEPTWRADGEEIVFSGRLADRSGSPVLLSVPADGSAEPGLLGDVQVIGRHPRMEPGA